MRTSAVGASKQLSFFVCHFVIRLEECDIGTRPSEEEHVDTSSSLEPSRSCKNLVRDGVRRDIRTVRRHVHLAQSLTQLVLIAHNYSADCILFALSALCTVHNDQNNVCHQHSTGSTTPFLSHPPPSSKTTLLSVSLCMSDGVVTQLDANITHTFDIESHHTYNWYLHFKSLHCIKPQLILMTDEL